MHAVYNNDTSKEVAYLRLSLMHEANPHFDTVSEWEVILMQIPGPIPL